MGTVHVYLIQVGKGPKGGYKTRYSFKTEDLHSSRAWLHYSSINIGAPYKKRLLRDGKLIARAFGC